MTRETLLTGIYKILKAAGLTDAAIYGMLGNWDKESNLEAGRVQGDFNPFQVTSRTYVKRVTSGEISRLSFAGDEKGFGLAQWTYWNKSSQKGRKLNLYDFWKTSGAALDDPLMQTRFCVWELQNEYSGVYKTLRESKDLYACVKIICDVYENPEYHNIDARYRAAVTIRDEMQTTTVIGEPVEPAADPEPEPETEQEPEILWPPRVLCAGMSGADVTALQGLLLAHGYDCKTTSGAFDARTKAMVLAFQGENGLDTDGIAGPLTWGKLLARG